MGACQAVRQQLNAVATRAGIGGEIWAPADCVLAVQQLLLSAKDRVRCNDKGADVLLWRSIYDRGYI